MIYLAGKRICLLAQTPLSMKAGCSAFCAHAAADGIPNPGSRLPCSYRLDRPMSIVLCGAGTRRPMAAVRGFHSNVLYPQRCGGEPHQ